MTRRLGLIGGLLALGAFLNLAVAWTWGLATSFTRGPALECYAALGEDHHWTVHRWNRPAATRIISKSWHGFGGGPYPKGSPSFLLAAWGRIEPPDVTTPGTVTQIDEAWGFPLRTVACRVTVCEQQDRSTLSYANLLALGAVNEDGQQEGYLPLRLIWWGFAVNSVLYGLLVLVVYAALRDLTRLGGAAARSTGERAPSPE